MNLEQSVAITLDEAQSSIVVDQGRQLLTGYEFTVLKALASKPKQLVTRDELHNALYGERGPAAANVLEVLISRIRKKFEALGAPRLITTIHGRGYSFTGEVRDGAAS